MDGIESNTDYNFGFGLLKAMLSFVVVTCHFYDGAGLLAFPEKIAVPIFIALSFWFVESSYEIKGKTISLKKIKRLLIPGIVWGVLYYFASLVMHIGANPKDLFLQILLGSDHLVNPTLWYLYDTALVMCLFMIIQKHVTLRRNYWIIRVLLMCVCILLQYTELNYMIFRTLSEDVRYSFGRLAEILPAACVGSLVSDMFIIIRKDSILSKNKGFPCFIICLIIYTLSYYLPVKNPQGFGYQGVIVLVGICLLLIGFYNLSIPTWLERPVIFIQQYGLGIYCIHMAVGETAEMIANRLNFQIGTFLFCLLVWLMCIVVCAVLDTASKKKLRFLIC